MQDNIIRPKNDDKYLKNKAKFGIWYGRSQIKITFVEKLRAD